MKPKEYPILEQAIQVGVLRGWRRAHKHVDEPEPSAIQETIERCVMEEICEWFDLDDGETVAESVAKLERSLPVMLAHAYATGSGR